MNIPRTWAIAQQEFYTQLTKPVFWALLCLLVAITMSLNPGVMIPSGDAAVGGVRPFLNSQHALAQFFALSSFFVYPFFAAIIAGLTVIRDEEANLSDLIHSTPLTPTEYIVGKFSGVLLVLGLAVLAHLVFALWMFQVSFMPDAEAVRGPFALSNFVLPTLLFAVPGIVFCAGLSFAAGERTRKPMAVYAVPIVYFLAVITFLWMWNPPGISPALNEGLAIIDPSGLRWLRIAIFDTDRGVDYYNTAPVALDATFALNRFVILALPLLAVTASIQHCRMMIGGGQSLSKKEKQRAVAALAPSAPVGTGVALLSFSPLRSLGMHASPPGFWTSAFHMTRAELRELRGQPGLYLLIPFIMFVVVEFAAEQGAVMSGRAIPIAGTMAVGAIEVLTGFVCLLLLFYTVESLNREQTTGAAAILYTAPFRTGALMLAKSLSNLCIVLVVLAACLFASIVALSMRGRGAPELLPFLIVWGGALMPTFFVWSAFVTAVWAIARTRYLTYVIGLGVLVWTLVTVIQGGMIWTFNWPLWGTLYWSDMGTFSLNGYALLVNRLLMVTLGIFFIAVALRFFARTARDVTATLHRFQPRYVARASLHLAPFALLPLLLGTYITYEVRTGFQSDTAQEEAKAYWRQNVATWKDVVPPRQTHVDLNIVLEPTERRMVVEGTYTMVNATDTDMAAVPFTVPLYVDDVIWTINGTPTIADINAGLHVLKLPSRLAPTDSIDIGFAYEAIVADGFTRNGGGIAQFILPSGVALHNLRNSFLPTPGFVNGIGIDASNRAAPAVYAEDFWQEPQAAGIPYTTRIEITAPEAYTVNAGGHKTAESTQDGRTTVVWESDYPLSVINIVAGRWAVREEGSTAVYYHSTHEHNVDEMLQALVAARQYYSEWFYPYPWQDLRLNEFPNLTANAQGFPTNIPFSEGIGFLVKPTSAVRPAFLVTAHEAAHQWWGNIVGAAEGPGTGHLIEGMAHYSALLLQEVVYGIKGRIALATEMEASYARKRRADSELPVGTIINDQAAADWTVVYEKGAWVMWMLQNQLGRDSTLSGLQAFIQAYKDSPVLPATQHLLATLRTYAADTTAYDAFVEQWFFDVVLPEYQITDATVTERDGRWEITATVTNVGTGLAEIEVAATRRERFAEEDTYSEKRITIKAPPNDPQPISLTVDFAPERLIVDPDALVLMLNRTRAVAALNAP